MVVGGGPEYYSNDINPAQARERFAEALDLILRCWTEPGPFAHTGSTTSEAMDRCGHLPAMERGDVLADKILGFLAE